ncbi:MAG: transketolase family protein [Spirochaetia bacterium]|nr:transketolase family protein [Spirochaetia bacterium]
MLIHDPLSDSLEKKATRDAYGKALENIGQKYSNVVVLDADLSGSTKTKGFSTKFPERFFNFGVAEQNLAGNAAGFAQTGLIPFASTFAMFLTGRAWEIVRNTVAYPNENVKLVATHAGITLGEDGASHQALEDIAIMRVIPNMTVVVPADYNQTWQAIHAAVEHKGPMYIRLGRPSIPMIYDVQDHYAIGKAITLQEGSEIAFVGAGIMVYESWKAARLIEKATGIRPFVIDMHTIKPLDTETLANIGRKVKTIYTFEEHNIIGGLGSAVSEYAAENLSCKVIRFGVNDQFGQSGTPDNLMDHYGLTGEKLAAKIIKNISVSKKLD